MHIPVRFPWGIVTFRDHALHDQIFNYAAIWNHGMHVELPPLESRSLGTSIAVPSKEGQYFAITLQELVNSSHVDSKAWIKAMEDVCKTKCWSVNEAFPRSQQDDEHRLIAPHFLVAIVQTVRADFNHDPKLVRSLMVQEFSQVSMREKSLAMAAAETQLLAEDEYGFLIERLRRSEMRVDEQSRQISSLYAELSSAVARIEEVELRAREAMGVRRRHHKTEHAAYLKRRRHVLEEEQDGLVMSKRRRTHQGYTVPDDDDPPVALPLDHDLYSDITV